MMKILMFFLIVVLLSADAKADYASDEKAIERNNLINTTALVLVLQKQCGLDYIGDVVGKFISTQFSNEERSVLMQRVIIFGGYMLYYTQIPEELQTNTCANVFGKASQFGFINGK